MKHDDSNSESRKYITRRRAMEEYLLNSNQLDTLPSETRRSPYYRNSSILVFNRQDVEKMATEVWGDLASLKSHRHSLMKDHKALFQELRKKRRENVNMPLYGEWTRQKLVVLFSVLVDFLNMLFKLVAYVLTLSDSMFAEFVHSLADLVNQLFLFIGVFISYKRPDRNYPYGHGNIRFIVALFSGVFLFCVGGASSIYVGVNSLFMRMEKKSQIYETEYYVAISSLVFGVITEIGSLGFAAHAIYTEARKRDVSFFYWLTNTSEPGMTIVLCEDAVAVVGLSIAITGVSVHYYYSTAILDSLGSIIIGILLGAISVLFICNSVKWLVGRSVPLDTVEKFNGILEKDVLIRSVHDVKATRKGDGTIHYKAEIDVDGAELTKLYLDFAGTATLFNEIKTITTEDEVLDFMVKHGARIVDLLGREIDRIEEVLMRYDKSVRHVDLEIL